MEWAQLGLKGSGQELCLLSNSYAHFLMQTYPKPINPNLSHLSQGLSAWRSWLEVLIGVENLASVRLGYTRFGIKKAGVEFLGGIAPL